MFSRSRLVPLFIAVLGLCSVVVGQNAMAGQSDLLVFPNHETMVKLAFDLNALRGTSMLVYEAGVDDPAQPYMHVWNGKSKTWIKVELADYSTGDALPMRVNRIFLVGSEPGVVEVLADASSWCKKIVPINSLRALDIVSAINGEQKLKKQEWEWLAERYQFTIKDANAERRRVGRYGKRGEKSAHSGYDRNPLVKFFRDLKAGNEETQKKTTDIETIEDSLPENATEGAKDVDTEPEPAKAAIAKEVEETVSPVIDAPADGAAVETTPVEVVAPQTADAAPATAVEMPAEDK